MPETKPRISFRYKGPVAGSPSYAFSVPERFAEGHKLTPGEAQALNQLMAENVQHNLRKVFLTELAACLPGELLEPAVVARIQETIDKYAAGYVFVFREQPRAKPGAIEAEALAIARELVGAEERQSGRELAEPDREAAIAAAAGLEWVLAEARERVEARASIVATAAEELL